MDISTREHFIDPSYIGSNASSIAQAVTVKLIAKNPSVITKSVGVASNDTFDDAQGTALNASEKAASIGFDALLQTNADEWAELLPSNSVDNFVYPSNQTLKQDFNIITLQILAVTNPWNLLQNTIGQNAIEAAANNTKLNVWSIPVGGLGSSAYAGWIFWDAEVWMAPGITVSHPRAVTQIANYRVQTFPQAQVNVDTCYQGSKNGTNFTPGGAAYPWVSGRYGNCTAAGPCFDYEYHLNGDIGLQMYNWYVTTGDTATFQKEYFPIFDAVSHFYSELLHYNSANDKYELLNATDPVGIDWSLWRDGH
jgi:trehalose/maltose hydrolase-like predicted phosphorylase